MLARLKKFAQSFEVDEFPLDERPVEILDLAAPVPGVTRSSRVPSEPDRESDTNGSGASNGIANGVATHAAQDGPQGTDQARDSESSPSNEDLLALVVDVPAEILQMPAAGADILSSLNELLLNQNAKLERLADELKPTGAHDDEFGKFARQAIKFIDGLDGIVLLARKFPAEGELAGWLRSVEVLWDRMVELFSQFDLKIMSCLGQKVDFNLHDVIEYRRTTDHPHNTVIEEIRRGVIFRGRVLRDAKVVVACNED